MIQHSKPPRFSVIVRSYNYQDYVVEAIQSTLNQTLPPHEVIVVDDGSSDGSWAILQENFAEDPKVILVQQPNAGQLAAWITGLKHSSGEIIALLDSDDRWEPNYLASMSRIYAKDPTVDFAYCNLKLFGARSGLMLRRRWQRRDRDLGTSVLLGCFFPRWQGVATSGNTLRRDLMLKLTSLPQAQIANWRIRPDDCLFYGADIIGAHKYYLASPLACHREHPNNALLQDRQPIRRMRYELRREQMLSHFRFEIGASSRLKTLAKTEFRTKPSPTTTEWWLYSLMAVGAPQTIIKRLGQVFGITGHFVRTSLTSHKNTTLQSDDK